MLIAAKIPDAPIKSTRRRSRVAGTLFAEVGSPHEDFCFAELRFGLIPKLLISPGTSAVFFPNLSRALANVISSGLKTASARCCSYWVSTQR